jgi:predicted transcriptional regulator
MSANPILSVRVKPEVYKKTHALAARRLESVSKIIESALVDYFEKIRALEIEYKFKD